VGLPWSLRLVDPVTAQLLTDLLEFLVLGESGWSFWWPVSLAVQWRAIHPPVRNCSRVAAAQAVYV